MTTETMSLSDIRRKYREGVSVKVLADLNGVTPDEIKEVLGKEPKVNSKVAKPLIFLLFGLPPFAFEKCLQSGESHIRSTGCPPVASIGSTSHTSSQ